MKESSNSEALFWHHQPCQMGYCDGFESVVSSTAIRVPECSVCVGDSDTKCFPTKSVGRSLDQPCSSFKIPVTEKDNPIPRFRTQLNAAQSMLHTKQDNNHYENVRFGCSASNQMIAMNNSLITQKGATSRSKTAVANKTRIKWTENLHNQFVDCVDRLGGAEMATPKAIVKMMKVEGLSILHVKSHLQKYRIGRHIPESDKGKASKKADSTTILDSRVGLQLKEALRQQLDVQRRLQEQLEIQTNLQRRIEEEWKKLRVLSDRHRLENKHNDCLHY